MIQRAIILVCLAAAFVRGQPDASCPDALFAKLTSCLEPMINYSSSLAKKTPEVNLVAFPLFSFETGDLGKVCQTFQKLKSGCLAETSELNKCKKNNLYQIFESLFGYCCGKKNLAGFFKHHECVAGVLKENKNCVELSRVPKIPTQSWDKCQPLPAFFACLKPKVEGTCGKDASKELEASLMHFGCKDVIAKSESDVRKRPVTKEAEMEKAPEAKEEPSGSKNAEATANNDKAGMEADKSDPAKPKAEGKGMGKDKVEGDKEAEKPSDSSKEKEKMGKGAGKEADKTGKSGKAKGGCNAKEPCFAPVKNVWNAYKNKVKADQSITIPMFVFSKPEILEFCDNHAATFLSCDREKIDACEKNAAIRLVDSILGFACANPSKFFKSFVCIDAIRKDNPECLKKLSFSVRKNECSGKADFEACIQTQSEELACRQNNAIDTLKEAMQHLKCQ